MGLCTQSGLGTRIPSPRSPRQAILWKRELRRTSTPSQHLLATCQSLTHLFPGTTDSSQTQILPRPRHAADQQTPKHIQHPAPGHSTPLHEPASLQWDPLSLHRCPVCWLVLKAGDGIPDPFCYSPPLHRCPQPYHPFCKEKQGKERVWSGTTGRGSGPWCQAGGSHLLWPQTERAQFLDQREIPPSASPAGELHHRGI